MVNAHFRFGPLSRHGEDSGCSYTTRTWYGNLSRQGDVVEMLKIRVGGFMAQQPSVSWRPMGKNGVQHSPSHALHTPEAALIRTSMAGDRALW